MVSEIQNIRIADVNVAKAPVPVQSTAVAGQTTSVKSSASNSPAPIQHQDSVAVLEKIRSEVSSSVDQLNQMMKDSGRDLSFAMDKELGSPVVVVKNSTTGEVVRQIPYEVVVQMAHEIESFKGQLHNEFT